MKSEDSEVRQNSFRVIENTLESALSEPSRWHVGETIGLFGELYLLRKLARLNSGVVNFWQGYSSKSRDFIFKSKYCVEVNNNIEDSTHHINNLNQVDPIDEHGGGTTLYLASIGVIEDEEGTDIPSLMDSLLEEIGDEEKQRKI